MRWLRWGTSVQMSKLRRASSTAAATTPSGVLTQNFAELPKPKGRSDTCRLHTSPTTVDGRSCSQFQKYYSTEMCSASETGSYCGAWTFVSLKLRRASSTAAATTPSGLFTQRKREQRDLSLSTYGSESTLSSSWF